MSLAIQRRFLIGERICCSIISLGTIISYLSVCIEDFDPLCGHEQIDLSRGRSLAVGALHSRRENNKKQRRERRKQLVN